MELNSIPIGVEVVPGTHREVIALGWVPYRGPSFCDAVSKASRGEKLLVTTESIEKCLWAPAVLGLNKPQSAFERSLLPHFETLKAIRVASVSSFEERGCRPDVVIIKEKRQRKGRRAKNQWI